LGAAKHHVRVLRLGEAGQCGQLAPFNGGVATLDGGSTANYDSVSPALRALIGVDW
jgi:hypothetical protein